MYHKAGSDSPCDQISCNLNIFRHVFLLERCRFWGGWDIEWELRIDDIMSVPHIVKNKLIFKIKKVHNTLLRSLQIFPPPLSNLHFNRFQEETFTFFSDDEKYIACEDKQVLKWLRTKLETVLMMNIEEQPCPGNMIKSDWISDWLSPSRNKR